MKKIETNGDTIFIKLPCGTITTISKEDKWLMNEFPVWGITGSRSKYVFVERSIKTEYSSIRERVYLHRIIVYGKNLSKFKNEEIDHIDRNRLNNCRNNLRICNRFQNIGNVAPRNNKKYKGVFDQSKYRKLKKPYASYIAYIDAKSRGLKKRKYIGHFETAEEAAKAYDKEAKKIYGEFAYQNFP